jgi:hypothetical protein
MSIVRRNSFASIVSKLAVLIAFADPEFGCKIAVAQDADAAKVELGSKTAKNGFRNEDEIRDKFNHWKADIDARAWLVAMNHNLAEIENVAASKPHGEKADVEVTVTTNVGETIDRISIKLVSSQNGFNQIDKRWLATYSTMWNMPPDVVEALELYVGEAPPLSPGRDSRRMYLDELDSATQMSVLSFFAAHKDEIVSDLLVGDGEHAANWIMVTDKASDDAKWVIRSTADAVRHFANGDVQMTKAGNLRIGRISMQRKGGDNGRPTANMLQFKMNPTELFELDVSIH